MPTLVIEPVGVEAEANSFFEVEGIISLARKKVRDVAMTDTERIAFYDTLRKVRLVLRRISKYEALDKVEQVKVGVGSAVIIVSRGSLPGVVLEPVTFYYRTNVEVIRAAEVGYRIYMGGVE